MKFEFTIYDGGVIGEVITIPESQETEEDILDSMDSEDTLQDLREKGFAIEEQPVLGGKRVCGRMVLGLGERYGRVK